MNTLLKWGLGVAALGVTAYVVGRAWKKSQAPAKKDLSNVDTGSSASMSGMYR
jgi:uncharacterized membrane protein YebE (DUF533 family)